MIIVTGGAGFIGSNIVRALNERGRTDVLIVDDLGEGDKYKNLIGLRFVDYCHKDNFMKLIKESTLGQNITAIFHEGACSDTMQYDVNFMMRSNYEYSKELLRTCIAKQITFIYASSASVYGMGKNGFREEEACENALNPYAFSKLIFDRYARQFFAAAKSKIIGLRYFNVFGQQESHKGKMASIFYQMYRRMKLGGSPKLFKGTDGYGDGEQRRDFVYVKDVVKVNLWCLDNNLANGIYNCGTGHAHTYNEVAKAMIDAMNSKMKTTYCDFPDALIGKYQSFTEADMTKLSAAGYKEGFTKFNTAVAEYCKFLEDGGYYTLGK
ncbi:MAG: ADP-glyceromanno-heptose 6-epimerase [Selenomonadaceae bacterium]|nr:ADP-glyceromanno-heptose 6-epimerase [Selenomonadaceae bacterium]